MSNNNPWIRRHKRTDVAIPASNRAAKERSSKRRDRQVRVQRSEKDLISNLYTNDQEILSRVHDFETSPAPKNTYDVAAFRSVPQLPDLPLDNMIGDSYLKEDNDITNLNSQQQRNIQSSRRKTGKSAKNAKHQPISTAKLDDEMAKFEIEKLKNEPRPMIIIPSTKGANTSSTSNASSNASTHNANPSSSSSSKKTSSRKISAYLKTTSATRSYNFDSKISLPTSTSSKKTRTSRRKINNINQPENNSNNNKSKNNDLNNNNNIGNIAETQSMLIQPNMLLLNKSDPSNSNANDDFNVKFDITPPKSLQKVSNDRSSGRRRFTHNVLNISNRINKNLNKEESETNENFGEIYTPENQGEIKSSFLPLHLFDDDSYDDNGALGNFIKNLPQKAECLYCFDGQNLTWRQCNVVKYQKPFFFIQWEGSRISSFSKKVYRISLRFPFDDPDRFEARRNFAFYWRSRIEREVKLFSDLKIKSQNIVNVPPLQQEIIAGILAKIPKDYHNTTTFQILSQDMISDYYFSDTIFLYIEDCKDQEKLKEFIKKGFLPFCYYVPNYYPCEKLSKSLINSLIFPPYDMMLSLNDKFLELKKYRLFDFKFEENPNEKTNCFKVIPNFNGSLKDQVIVDVDYFFNKQHNKVSHIQNNCQNGATSFLIMKTKELLTKWPKDTNSVNNIIKMIDLRITNSLENITTHSMSEFILKMDDDIVLFEVIVSNQLSINNPQFKEIIEKGNAYLNKVFNSLENCVSSMCIAKSTRNEQYIHQDLEVLTLTKNECIDNWEKMAEYSFNSLENVLIDLKDKLSAIPLNDLNSINDIIDDYNIVEEEEEEEEVDENKIIKNHKDKNNTSNKLLENIEGENEIKSSKNKIDLALLKSLIVNARKSLNHFIDNHPLRINIGLITVDFSQNLDFLKSQCEKMKQISCEFITSEIAKLTDSVGHQIKDLKERCQRTPDTIEDWYKLHLLLMNLRANFGNINEGLNSTMDMFNFLEEFYYEPQSNENKTVKVEIAYYLKSELQKLWKSLPDYIKLEEKNRERLAEIHEKENQELEIKVNKIFERIWKYHIKNDVKQISLYRKDLESINDEFVILSQEVEIARKRDHMISSPIKEYENMPSIKKFLDLFIPFWDIAENLDSKVENWMSIPFLELNPEKTVNTVQSWEKIIHEIKIFFEDLNDFTIDGVLVKRGQHPLLQIWRKLQDQIDDLINHIPIMQHFCNHAMRNRHWSQISEVSGLNIDPNQGLTWHWIIESQLEEFLSEIANISRSANFEYKIEKALNEMTEQIRNISLDLERKENKIRINDTSPILKTLADHQCRIQEIFIPPYIKPFMMKIKEYNSIALNLRRILKKTLDAQSEIDDLAPAMDSRDIRTQNQQVTAEYDENLVVFHRFVNKFGNPSQFHELVSNPKYFSIIEDLQGNLRNVKKGLEDILSEKRKIFPYFRLLSDSQLIYLISYSHIPTNFKTFFGYIYPGILEATFSKDEKQCTGFISTDGEIVNFLKPFNITPESIETLFENFDNSIISTMKTTILSLSKTQILNISKVVLNNPSQIVTTTYQIIFNQKMSKIFESESMVFAGRKATFLEQQFQTILAALQTDIGYLGDMAKTNPSTSILNLITVLIKQRDIITSLIKNCVTDQHSYNWTKYMRYIASGEKEDSFQIQVACGPNSFNYGFSYIGGGPLQFQTESNERIYAMFMTSLSQCFNTVVSGPLQSLKTSIIKNFAQCVGKNYMVYSCSSGNSVDMLTYLMETASLTNIFLILRDISLIADKTFSDLAPILLSFNKKKLLSNSNNNAKKGNKQLITLDNTNITSPVMLFSTFNTSSTSTDNNCLPSHLRLLFRPINLNFYQDTKQILDNFLYGVGLGENDQLKQQLSVIVNTLGMTAEHRFAAKFSVRNIMKIIIEKPLDHKDPSKDLCKRLVSQFRDLREESNEIQSQLCNIFKVNMKDICINCNNSKNGYEIPKEFLPSSPILQENMKYFLEMLEFHSDIIVIGEAFTGKSTLINNSAKAKNSNVTYIYPYAQPFSYLAGNKSDGILYNSIMNHIDSSNWIVFDSKCSDEWMNILAVSMADRQLLYFSDGSCLKITEKLQFIYETDSLAEATPSLLSFCARIVLPSNTITFKELNQNFINKISKDERIVDPLSHRILGTTIPISKFIEKVNNFLLKLVPSCLDLLTEDDLILCSKNQILSNFYSILESVLCVHYYNEMKLPAFHQQNIHNMIEDFENHAIFAAIWSFGGHERIKFNKNFRSLLNSKAFNSRDSSSSAEIEILKSFNNIKENVFDLYYDTVLRKWCKWEDLEIKPFYDTQTAITDILPEYILVNPNVLMSSLYLTDCLISQNQSILMDEKGGKTVTNLLMTLGINTENIGSRFSSLCFDSPNDSPEILRKMIEQSINNVRDGQRSSTRIPLLSLLGVDVSWSEMTELLRSVLEHKSLVDLTTFREEPSAGLTIMGNFDSLSILEPNQRFLRHFVILHFPEMNEEQMKRGLSQSIQKLCGIGTKTDVITSIMLKTITELDPRFKFSIGHLLKLIQRVAMTMESQPKAFFTNALCFESISVFYDLTKSNSSLTKLDKMISQVGTELNQRYRPLNEIANKFLLSNLRSSKFRPISSLDEIQSPPNSLSNSAPTKKIRSIHSCLDLAPSHGRFIENYNCSNAFISKSDLPISEQLNVIRLIRSLTTPRTHVLINCEMPTTAENLLIEATNIMNFGCTFYRTADNLMKVLHDTFVLAGKTEIHQALIIQEDYLSKEDSDLLRAIVVSTNIFGLFGPNEILFIMSELHCSMADEDPFHEETLESKPNYHLLVRDFLRNCNHYFHLCIISSENSPNFEYYFEHTSPITITHEMTDLINNAAHLDSIENCNYRDELAKKIIQKLYTIPYFVTRKPENTLSTMKCISHLFKTLFMEHIKKHEERYNVLSKISTIIKKTETDLSDTLNKHEGMEEEVEKLAKEIEKLMLETKKASEEAKQQKDMLEGEEHILQANQLQAEQLRQESQQQLATTKPILQQSTQELKNLSSRDISVIKSMNHPPKGVFLVVKSIVVVFGNKIEDKTDEPSATQPSWILGKKLLSDTSFLSNLMKRALENVDEKLVDSLQPIVDDPNFQPSVVKNSSTAAKSICEFIRAIIPYYHAMRVFEMKQKELRSCEETLNMLQQQHDAAKQKVLDANLRVQEIEEKKTSFKQQKHEIEEKIKNHKNSVESSREAMELMKTFFDEWSEEMNTMNKRRVTLETRTYFISCCLALFSVSSVNDRDQLFSAVHKIFQEIFSEEFKNSGENIDEYYVNSRKELVEELRIDLNVKFPGSEFGLEPPLHWVENVAMLRIFVDKWCFVIDQEKTIMNILKPIVTKKIAITSYMSLEFEEDLYNSIVGNDLLIIYDYDYNLMNSIFFQIEKNKGAETSIQIANKQIIIPIDFQIVFILDQFPETSLFNAIFVDLCLTNEEIKNKAAESLYVGLNSEKAHETLTAIASESESVKELLKTKNELQSVLLNSVSNLLKDEGVIKQFQSAHNIIVRLQNHVIRLKENSVSLGKEFGKIIEKATDFVEIYRKSEILEGVDHFYDIMKSSIEENTVATINNINTNPNLLINVNSDENVNKRIEKVLEITKTKVASESSLKRDFDRRVVYLARNANIDISYKDTNKSNISGKFDEIMNKIVDYYKDPNILSSPFSTPNLVSLKESSNRNPIVIKSSYLLYKHISSFDKIKCGHISTIVNDYQTAIHEGKMLCVFMPSNSLFPQIISIICKMRSAASLSQDFRLIIFVSSTEFKELLSMTKMANFCHFIDTSCFINIRKLMSYSLSSLPANIFETSFSGQTNNWRRIVLLLSYFDSSANLLTETIFNNSQFNEENIDLLVQYSAKISPQDLSNYGEMFINTFYGTEQPHMIENLLKIWKIVFSQENRSNGPVSLFPPDEYKLPFVYTPSTACEIPTNPQNSFPLIDKSSVYSMPLTSNQYYKEFHVKKWNFQLQNENNNGVQLAPNSLDNSIEKPSFSISPSNSNFVRNNMTSIELKPLQPNEVVWYLRGEAEEINVRVLHEQNVWKRSFRELLKRLKMKKPAIDLSILFQPKKFFYTLKHNYVLNNQSRFEDIGLLLTTEQTEISIENLIILNAEMKDGKFEYAAGSRKLPLMYLKVVKIDEEKMTRVQLYSKGDHIEDIMIYPINALPDDSVFLLTEFD